MKSLSYKYKGKLLLNFTALFAIFAAVLVAFQMHREHSYREELLYSRLRGYADIVANTIETQEHDKRTHELQRLARLLPNDLRLTVITSNGKVVFESDGIRLESMGSHLDRPEVKDAMTSTEGSDIRHSDTTKSDYFYFAKSYGGFIVRLAQPYNYQIHTFLKADNIFLWFVLFIFPIVLVMLIYISDRFGKAVAGLRHFIDSADRGLVDYAHITFPQTELGDISRSIMQKYKQLEESGRQVAAERERLMRHLHYFEEGIAIFSADRKKVYANPRFMQYVNTILDRPTPDINTIWKEPAFAPAIEFLDLNGNTCSNTASAPIFRFTLSAGGNYFGLQLLLYGDGSFEMTLADITRAEKNKLLKQQMSNNITHELRTPVSSIRGYIETVLTCSNLSEERRNYFLQKAHSQVIRLTDLIRDVALITKTEEAPDTMQREQLQLRRIVDDIIEELRPGLDKAKMTVENRIPENVEEWGNYSLIYSVFRNLIENSIRYAGQGTSIVVECYNQDDAYCYFRYYDTGKGVAEEHLSRLFERFYRVTEGRTRDNGGTGLGLSIVRNAVLFHSGDISVRNRKGGGLEFLFTLKK